MTDVQPPSGATSPAPKRKRGPRPRAVPLSPEVRFYAPTQIEVRSAGEGSPDIMLSGTAIVYGAQYTVRDMFGEFRETIHAGAASDLVARKVDCRLLFNHGGLPLARTVSGTMTLIDDPDALRFTARLDARQQLANDFSIAIERGDLSQMSVGMIVSRDKWGEDALGETRDVFTLADLLDVSGVTYPCSPTTHIEVARRMAMQAPLESRARLRSMEVELRAGKVLSSDSQAKLVAALSALHDLAASGGVDPAEINSSAEPDAVPDAESVEADGSEDGQNVESDASIVYSDGSGARADEPAAEERADPTDADWGISNALKTLKMELAGVKAKQLADPDNATDPDDAAVMDAINAAEVAIDKAIVAQSKDGRYEPKQGSDMTSMRASTLRLMVEAGRNPSG